ncbi:MAG: hypothetical protein IPG00_22035 [Saprospiraceae bacterium]|nr:hypothetical protein [Saprospiraceae bacterium]
MMIFRTDGTHTVEFIGPQYRLHLGGTTTVGGALGAQTMLIFSPGNFHTWRQ